MAKKNSEQPSFEQALTRLDKIVALLECGDTTLEQSLGLYAEGAALIERCGSQLKEAQLKIETLALPKEGPFDELS